MRAALSQRKRAVSYRLQRLRPVDEDLAVFAAYWYRGYSCNPRAIFEAARERVPGLRGVWVVKPGAIKTLPAGIEHVQPNTPEYFDVLARARVLVNNVNFPNHVVKRDGTTHVMTHHGTPLKRMGFDIPDTGRHDRDALLRRCARWDYSVSANPFSTQVWERAYPVPFTSLETGYPRNDVLARATADEVAAARTALGVEGRVVLYAPTHREYLDKQPSLIDLDALASRLGDDWTILARSHYFYGRKKRARHGVRDVSDHPSVEELCLAADVLLTDYSSIMFDYAVLDRPIVIHAPDWEEYRERRGTYFDLLEEPPGPVARTDDEVLAALQAGDPGAAQRAAFRARFCSLEDGHAAERVVQAVWGC